MAEHDQRYRPSNHLVRSVDFDRVYRRRATASDDLLLVFADRNTQYRPRLGLSVSRKIGNAVVRNRWKRRLREAFRLNQSSLPQGVDLIVIPRPIDEPPFELLTQSLIRLAARAVRKLPPL